MSSNRFTAAPWPWSNLASRSCLCKYGSHHERQAGEQLQIEPIRAPTHHMCAPQSKGKRGNVTETLKRPSSDVDLCSVHRVFQAVDLRAKRNRHWRMLNSGLVQRLASSWCCKAEMSKWSTAHIPSTPGASTCTLCPVGDDRAPSKFHREQQIYRARLVESSERSKSLVRMSHNSYHFDVCADVLSACVRGRPGLCSISAAKNMSAKYGSRK